MNRRVDVSQIVWLRKRLGRAQLATKLAGIAAAPVAALAAYEVAQRPPGWVGMGLALGAALVTIGAGFRLAQGLRRGSRSAIRALAVAFVVYAAVCVLQVVGGVETPQLTLIGRLDLALWVGTTYFILRGLLAVRAWKARPADTGRELAPVTSPWESGRKGSRPSAFANKRRLGMYLFLALLPVPFIAALYVILNLPPDSAQANDAPAQRGYQEGLLVTSLLIYVPPTVAIYRKARRRAVRRATDFLNNPDRSPVLYLRSFQDDKLKMWARAANGRSWLEAALRVSFEEVIVDHLFHFGPVIAIGRPGEGEAPLGAAREYVNDTAWRERVKLLMHHAAVIVVVLGRSEGLLWEIGQILESGLIHKLVLLIPPVNEKDLSPRWQSLREQLFHGAPLAGDIDLSRTRAVLFRAGAGPLAIEAEDRDAWSYEVALDAAVHLAEHDGADFTFVRGQLLSGVPTAQTDRIGRLANGLCRGFVIAQVIAVARFIPALAVFAAGSANVEVAGVASGALQALLAWLITTRWLPEVSRRERLLVAALAASQPIAAALGASGNLLSAEAGGLLYGAYFGIRYRGGTRHSRRPTPRWLSRLNAVRQPVGRVLGGLGRAVLVALSVSVACSLAATSVLLAAPGNALLAGLVTGVVQAAMVWFIASGWLPEGSRRERLLAAGLSASHIPIALLFGVDAPVSYALLSAIVFGIYFAIRRDRMESGTTRTAPAQPLTTNEIGVAH